jgi:hypothetical protein
LNLEKPCRFEVGCEISRSTSGKREFVHLICSNCLSPGVGVRTREGPKPTSEFVLRAP